jgi:hypothetical protein
LFTEWINGSSTNYQSYADWQQLYFGSTNAPGSAPGQDPDGDGAINELEYLTGTNPLLAGDGWGILATASQQNVQIGFERIANRGFEVMWTTNISNATSWRPLDVHGNEPVFSITNSVASIQDTLTNATARYYRVRVFEP